jgi:hypothetical protein
VSRRQAVGLRRKEAARAVKPGEASWRPQPLSACRDKFGERVENEL